MERFSLLLACSNPRNSQTLLFRSNKQMEELKSVMEEHFDLMSDLVQKISSELRSNLRPAYDNFLGFFHAIDWKEPWLLGLLTFHVVLLLVTIISRRNTNFQMFLFLLTLAGVYLAERLNSFLGENWKNFSSQNYFDPSGVFMSVLWSGPLLALAMIILINTLFSLCYLIVKWKRAELRHRARAAHFDGLKYGFCVNEKLMFLQLPVLSGKNEDDAAMVSAPEA
ncbi:transmembrane protein [Trifolium repens]|nr:transmembrane protein [Trifolium repens]